MLDWNPCLFKLSFCEDSTINPSDKTFQPSEPLGLLPLEMLYTIHVYNLTKTL